MKIGYVEQNLREMHVHACDAPIFTIVADRESATELTAQHQQCATMTGKADSIGDKKRILEKDIGPIITYNH